MSTAVQTQKKFRPMGERIAVRRIDEEKTEGLIVVQQKNVLRGSVVAVSEDLDLKTKLKVGDIVHYTRYMVSELNGCDIIDIDTVFAVEVE